MLLCSLSGRITSSSPDRLTVLSDTSTTLLHTGACSRLSHLATFDSAWDLDLTLVNSRLISMLRISTMTVLSSRSAGSPASPSRSHTPAPDPVLPLPALAAHADSVALSGLVPQWKASNTASSCGAPGRAMWTALPAGRLRSPGYECLELGMGDSIAAP
ncbi:hypothetical protein PYCCODRAFT_1008171 [Trametes coccinea BRFM310]|uniref:Uncharacterized protein n=1 Tax=Trametes coccinea (strain BRFM310) TaxID=1353009 RepID=A0A1Y2IBA6_TRAC3|nr:hypothetical protein PYCCODRAFT_1008171 [Trametes coccinea BRFM310]